MLFFCFVLFSCSVVPDSLWPHRCSPPGSSVCEISQARILEWVAISFSRVSYQTRDQTWVSCRQVPHHWATREAREPPVSGCSLLLICSHCIKLILRVRSTHHASMLWHFWSKLNKDKIPPPLRQKELGWKSGNVTPNPSFPGEHSTPSFVHPS